MPASTRSRSCTERVRGHRRLHVPEERAAAVRPRRQPRAVELLAELGVDAEGGLVQVEALQASRRGRQRRPAVGPLADPPRLPERHADLGADDAHVPLQVPQLHRVERQALAFQPAQVIDQQIRVRPLRARAVVPAQEPVSLAVDRALGPDDRPRPPSALPLDLLDPQVPDHDVPCHSSSVPISANMTDVPNPVGKQPRDVPGSTQDGRHVRVFLRSVKSPRGDHDELPD